MFSFTHCYVHQINKFNKLLKNIYQYNKLIINELINIIKADIMLYIL